MGSRIAEVTHWDSNIGKTLLCTIQEIIDQDGEIITMRFGKVLGVEWADIYWIGVWDE